MLFSFSNIIPPTHHIPISCNEVGSLVDGQITATMSEIAAQIFPKGFINLIQGSSSHKSSQVYPRLQQAPCTYQRLTFMPSCQYHSFQKSSYKVKCDASMSSIQKEIKTPPKGSMADKCYA